MHGVLITFTDGGIDDFQVPHDPSPDGLSTVPGLVPVLA